MKYVITGGPCSGKSSILQKLRNLGYKTIDEAARQVKQEQDLLHHPVAANENPYAFQVLVDARQHYLESKYDGTQTFLDRGKIDQQGYCYAYGMKLPKELEESLASTDYAGVFLLETVPQHLYVKDAQRPETHDESSHIASCLKRAYQERGYRVVDIPFMSIDEQVDKIIDTIYDRR